MQKIRKLEKFLKKANKEMYNLYRYASETRNAILLGKEPKFIPLDDLDDVMLFGKDITKLLTKPKGAKNAN